MAEGRLNIRNCYFTEEGREPLVDVRVMSRLYLNPVSPVPAVSYLRLLLEERFAMAYPEETAAHWRAVF